MQLLEFRREGVIKHPRPPERLISSVSDTYFKTMLKQTRSRLGAHLAVALLVAWAQGQPTNTTSSFSPPTEGWKSAAGAETTTVFAWAGDAVINRRRSTFRAPGVDDLFGMMTYTVLQSTYDTIATLQ